MIYDSDNDRIINDDESIQLKPNQIEWRDSYSISLEVGDEYLVLEVNQINDVIDGLQQAKTRLIT